MVEIGGRCVGVSVCVGGSLSCCFVTRAHIYVRVCVFVMTPYNTTGVRPSSAIFTVRGRLLYQGDFVYVCSTSNRSIKPTMASSYMSQKKLGPTTPSLFSLFFYFLSSNLCIHSHTHSTLLFITNRATTPWMFGLILVPRGQAS
jgi:hypothetical protein